MLTHKIKNVGFMMDQCPQDRGSIGLNIINPED